MEELLNIIVFLKKARTVANFMFLRMIKTIIGKNELFLKNDKKLNGVFVVVKEESLADSSELCDQKVFSELSHHSELTHH